MNLDNNCDDVLFIKKKGIAEERDGCHKVMPPPQGNRKIAIVFEHVHPWTKTLQVASERTTMDDAVPNPYVLVSKFRI